MYALCNCCEWMSEADPEKGPIVVLLTHYLEAHGGLPAARVVPEKAAVVIEREVMARPTESERLAYMRGYSACRRYWLERVATKEIEVA